MRQLLSAAALMAVAISPLLQPSAVQAAPAQAHESAAGVETGPGAAQQVQPSYDLAAVW